MNPSWNGSNRRNGGLWNSQDLNPTEILWGIRNGQYMQEKPQTCCNRRNFTWRSGQKFQAMSAAREHSCKSAVIHDFCWSRIEEYQKLTEEKSFLTTVSVSGRIFFKSQQFALDVLHHHINRSSDGIPKKGTYLMQRMPQSEKEMTTKQPIKISLIFVVWCSGLSQPLYFWTS